MPPIPVYTDSPIAAKASAVTPQTASPDAKHGATPATISTTALPTKTQVTYPQAQPGAAPSLPTPAASSAAYSAYAQPMSTQESRAGAGPPPPAPGAVPKLPGSHISPPPKVGEKFVPLPASTVPYPPQMLVPAPTAAYPAQQSGTSTAPLPLSTSGGQGQSLQHPPGYQQNTNASELDRYQASSVVRNDSEREDAPEEGVWGAARKWAQDTGKKLAAAETEVWKRINKE